MLKFSNTIPLPSRIFGRGGFILYLLFIFPGRYLKADHFEKKNWTWVVGHSKMLRGRGGLKNYEC